MSLSGSDATDPFIGLNIVFDLICVGRLNFLVEDLRVMPRLRTLGSPPTAAAIHCIECILEQFPIFRTFPVLSDTVSHQLAQLSPITLAPLYT